MKKFILILYVVSILFLAGCSTNSKNNNDDILDNKDNQMQDIDNNSVTQSAEEKYKISDTYYISGERLEYDECLIKLNRLSTKYKQHNYVESDGMEFDITCEIAEVYEESQQPVYDVKVNGKTIDFYLDASPFGGIVIYDRMWLIDLDEKDQYKELAIERTFGLDSEFDIYRLTKNGLELLFYIDNSWNEFLRVDNKWIFTNYFYSDDKYQITEGYYLYEDGEFKYIDRFATGESIIDENGMFPENFQKLEFYSENETISIEYKDGSVVGKFNLISYREAYNDKNTYYPARYNIRLTEDSKYYVQHWDSNGNFSYTTTELLPEGTILEDVEIWFSW